METTRRGPSSWQSEAAAGAAPAGALAIPRKPAVWGLFWLPADRCEGAAAVRDFAGDESPAQALGGFLGFVG